MTRSGRGGKRLARPERVRVSLWDDAIGATPLELPRRRMWHAGLFIGAFFAVFAAIWWVQASRLNFSAERGMSDMLFNLFNLFWVMGWTVGVVILGLLTVLFLFYDQAARITGDRLVTVSKLGPVKIFSEYLLRDIRNLRLVNARNEGEVSVRFDYAAGDRGLGDAMPREDAERLIAIVRAAMPMAMSEAPSDAADEEPLPTPPREAHKPAPARSAEPLPLDAPSALFLLAANLVPLAGVLFLGWGMGNVMVLYWAESAIIGFYTLLKMAVVGKFVVLLAGPFFVGHFGGFMAAHFLFIYGLFLTAGLKPSQEPPVLQALATLFFPLWPALLALLLSHGISFAMHFVAGKEYQGQTVSGLMTAPYRRIFIMQLAVIVGAWGAALLKSALPALLLLVALKTAADLRAHRSEHRPGTDP